MVTGGVPLAQDNLDLSNTNERRTPATKFSESECGETEAKVSVEIKSLWRLSPTSDSSVLMLLKVNKHVI